MRPFRRGPIPSPLPDGTVVAEVVEGKRTIQRVIRDGKEVCMCPFACLATYERCAFDLRTPDPDPSNGSASVPDPQTHAGDHPPSTQKHGAASPSPANLTDQSGSSEATP
jgi:hypothetical protein